jgi:Zn-dependent protease with chaperone function
LWKATLRNTDQVGMKFTRVSDAEESKLGEELARGFPASASDPAAAYVTQVAQPLLAHVRRHGIRYQFHIVDSPEVNAFALPGGQIFIMRGMLEFTNSEAELAAATLFLRMKTHYHEPGRRQATTPAGEASQAVNEGLGAFFRSHPPSEERCRRMHDQVQQNRSTLAGRSFYIGKRNLEERKARSAREYPDEFFTF